MLDINVRFQGCIFGEIFKEIPNKNLQKLTSWEAPKVTASDLTPATWEKAIWDMPQRKGLAYLDSSVTQ